MTHHKAKLQPFQVQEIRRLFWTKGFCQQCLAIMYNISSAAIHDAVHYKTWPGVRDVFKKQDICSKRRAKYYEHK